MRTARAEGLAVTALVALAVVAALLVPTYPNYDSYFHLAWGRELLHGVKPGFEAYAAPTEHPLFLALCAVLTLFGGDADRLLVLVCVVSLVLLAWSVFRLGRAVWGPWPGLAAAFFTGSSFAFLLYAARAYVDMPFLALVLWAAALEAERPRRGTPVMAILAVAGLLRPEAWILAGAYWLWCGPLARPARPRLGLAALAIGAPLVWAAVDLWVTGDPLYSLHATSDLADELNRNRGLSSVPGSFVSFLTDTARPPVALAGALGVALAWKLRAGRAIHVPAALFGAGALTFPTLPRGSRERRAWSRAAAVLAVIGAAFVVVKAPVVNRLVTELRFIRTTHDDLASILHAPAVQRDLRCGPLTFPNYRLLPDARWILDLPQARVGARSAHRHAHGVAMFVLGEKELRRFGFAAGASSSTNAPDPGFAPTARNASYAAYASCAS
jgi:hypothetical protein